MCNRSYRQCSHSYGACIFRLRQKLRETCITANRAHAVQTGQMLTTQKTFYNSTERQIKEKVYDTRWSRDTENVTGHVLACHLGAESSTRLLGGNLFLRVPSRNLETRANFQFLMSFSCFFTMAKQPQWAKASSLSGFHDHTQKHQCR